MQTSIHAHAAWQHRLTSTLDGDSDERDNRIPRLGEHVSREQPIFAELPLMHGEDKYEANSDKQGSKDMSRVPGVWATSSARLGSAQPRATDKGSCPR